MAPNLTVNLIGAITVKLYDGSHNLLATNTAKLAHIKELTATQKQFSSAFIVQSGTCPTGGVSSSWECGAWLPAIDTKPVTAEIEIVGTGTDGGNSWERAGFSGSADRTFSLTVPARFSSRAKVIMDAMDAASNLLSDAFPAAFASSATKPGDVDGSGRDVNHDGIFLCGEEHPLIRNSS